VLDPDNSEAHTNRGNILGGLGRPEEALAAYDQALAVDPGLAGAHTNRGNVLRDLGRPEDALAAYDRTLAHDPGHAETYINRGNILSELGRAEEALSAFDRVLVHSPEHAEAHDGRGSALIALGRLREASDAFDTALRHDPGLVNATYFLAAIKARDIPVQSPQSYIVELFDDAAVSFDNKLVKQLGYRVPEQLFDAVRNHTGTKKLDILDLGCGTGLCGVAFSTVIRRMVGVDLAPRMLEKARERGLYADLIQSDVCHALEECRDPFNLILATDVFIYIGALEEVFSLVVNRLSPGGLFAFSLEVNDHEVDYELRISGRYAQSMDYIRRLAMNSGFEELTYSPVTIRYECGEPVAGSVVVLRHPDNPGVNAGD